MAIPAERFGQVVILVRHGEAVDKAIDPTRPLSEEGRAQAAAAGSWLAGLGLEVAEVRHSGKARAAETAALVGARLGIPAEGIAEAPHLAPNDDVEAVAEELEVERRSLLLAGHLPHLARLASRLLSGEPERVQIRFPAAGALVLGRIRGAWHLVSFASHEVL